MTTASRRSNRIKVGAMLAIVVVAVAGGYVFMTWKPPATSSTGAAGPDPEKAGEPLITFNEHIGPLLHRNCAVCHRPGGSGPFSLLDYDDARKRAGLIADVTARRYMPPWLPERGLVDFLGERGLDDADIELIRTWVAQGAPQGNSEKPPPPPDLMEGWHLGEPDLVVTMAEPYRLAAEGVDVFRNFVIPVPLTGPRWVKAVELRPGNPRVVHHAIIQLDRSRSSRHRDEEDGEPGFPGMDMAGSETPGGQFIGWTPGKLPIEDERLAWRLEPGSDFVLQLHMLPSGKVESLQPQIGLYFTDKRPEKQAVSVLLRNDDIDIPPGADDYVIEDTLKLPVTVTALGIYPHAHYLGKRLEAFAALPDGHRQWLIRIPRWDFNWQDDYRFAEPIELPAGTLLTMRYAYDNSSANPLNPSDPPVRVRFGNRSTDEMATLTLQVVPARPEDQNVLLEATMRGQLARNPNHWFVRTVLGSALRSQGKYQEAIEHLQEAVRLAPGNPAPLYNLGNTKLEMGRLDEALEHYRRVIAIEPNHPKVHNNIAVAYQQRGDNQLALEQYRAQLELSPGDSRAHANMGIALLEQGDIAGADESFRRALDLDPESTQALEGRGDVGRLSENHELAEMHYRRALALDNDSPAAHYGLGRLRLAQGRPEQSRDHLRRAMGADPAYVGVINDDAWRLATHPDPGERAPATAVFLADVVNEHTDRSVPELLDTLAAAQAANGEFDRAVGTLEKAMSLARSGSASEYLEEFRERLALYQHREPYTDPSAH